MTIEVTTFALKFDFILDLASDLWPVVYPLGVFSWMLIQYQKALIHLEEWM